jgi:5-methylcytosine-specific restriction endonuclease McrA
VDKDEYQQYLKSGHWHFIKAQALIRVGNKCSKCGSESELHVHHLNYEHLFTEKPEDIIVLCETCHTREHDKLDDVECPTVGFLAELARDAKRREEFGV